MRTVEERGDPDLIKRRKIAKGVTCDGEEDGENPCQEIDLPEEEKCDGYYAVATNLEDDAKEILEHKFIKLFPLYLRPYGRLYAY